MKKAAMLILVSLLAACSADDKVEQVAKEGITKNFNDPSSVQYRNVTTTAESPQSPYRTTCGELNAKNQYGAYIGFKKFVVVTEMQNYQVKYYQGATEDDYRSFSRLDTQYCKSRK